MAIGKTKQQQRQLEAKNIEKAKAKQVAYDSSMTKTAQSLTTQLRDVARAFCHKVWDEALNATGVNVDSKLRALNKVYYPSVLRLAPNLMQPQADPSTTSTSAQHTTTSTITPVAKKRQHQLTPVPVMDVESEEVSEVGKLKKKKKEREKDASV